MAIPGDPASGSGGEGPTFRHIHCSSRFDRSAASLESDLDDWMAKSDLITLTEVQNDKRASKLREKGWSHFNSPKGNDADNCAIAWRTEDWKRRFAAVRQLTDHPYQRAYQHNRVNVYAASVVLRRTDSSFKLLVSVTHLPAHVEGAGHWRTDTEQWLARKKAYLTSLKHWETLTKDLERKHNTDATLLVADWNLNLKEHWVRQLLNDRWGKKYHLAWRNFPTTGGSLTGGSSAPAGAPGKGTGDRIIDGSLYRGLKVTSEPELMSRVSSSDHRPYSEAFRFFGTGETPTDPDGTEGNVKPGEEWWGFGDYMDDEIYQINRV